MPAIDPMWVNVNEDAQIWAGHSDAHKQFILRAPAAVLAVEAYKGSYRFDTALVIEGGDQVPLEFSLADGYPEAWIRQEDTTLEAYEEDPVGDDDGGGPPPVTEPGEYTNEEIGAAFRLLADVLLGR